MAGRVIDYRAKVQAAIEREMRQRIKECCVLVKYKGVTKRVRKGKLIYGANPSKPGEPPHKQKGRLHGSVAFTVDGLIGRVGTNVLYGKFLELGTRRMAARPWLRRALKEKESEIKTILSTPIRFRG
jgi:HK97 gp10 family phage protein